MTDISTFLKGLNIGQTFQFSSTNKIEIFGLWQIEILSPRQMLFHSKNAYFEWEEKDICDCYVQVSVHKGSIDINTGFAQCLNEALDHQDEIMGWLDAFQTVIFNRLCDLYDENGLSYRQESDNLEIKKFITSILRQDNFEKLSCLIRRVHDFFRCQIFGEGVFTKYFPFSPRRIRISSLVNLITHPAVISKFNQHLSNHYVIVRLIQISEDLLNKIERTNFSSNGEFARLILSNINDDARFSNNEINFFLNCGGKALEELSNSNENFIKWLKFFAEVAYDCHYEDIDLLFKKFMLIGYENSVRNKAYIKKIFTTFKERSFDDNNHDLKYALKYSLIFNSINWDEECTDSLDELMISLDSDIESIRKKNILLGFIKLKNLNTNFLRSNFSFENIPCDFVRDLIVNCNLLLGVGGSSANDSNMAFMVQKIDEHYVLVASEIEADSSNERSLYHILLSDDLNASLGMGASSKMQEHFSRTLLNN